MKHLLRPVPPMLLIVMQPQQQRVLFRVYRDYLIFLNLVRDLVHCQQHRIFGFCCLKSEAWLLIRPSSGELLTHLLKLLKRHFLWLRQYDNGTEQFNLRATELVTTEQMLDALRYVHSRPAYHGQVHDALDYQWHSYPVYHKFWQLSWLNTRELLSYFSTNDILATNAFRQYMQRCGAVDYLNLMEQATDQSYFQCRAGTQATKNTQLAEPERGYLSNCDETEIHLEAIPAGIRIKLRMP